MIESPFCHGDEENGHRACTNGHLTTADQREIRKTYLVSANGYKDPDTLGSASGGL